VHRAARRGRECASAARDEGPPPPPVSVRPVVLDDESRRADRASRDDPRPPLRLLSRALKRTRVPGRIAEDGARDVASLRPSVPPSLPRARPPCLASLPPPRSDPSIRARRDRRPPRARSP
jgi:hypothetical protein